MYLNVESVSSNTRFVKFQKFLKNILTSLDPSSTGHPPSTPSDLRSEASSHPRPIVWTKAKQLRSMWWGWFYAACLFNTFHTVRELKPNRFPIL